MSTDTNSQVQTFYGKILGDKFVIDGRLSLDTFVPSRYHLVVKRLPPETMSKGGIHIPEQAREQKSLGFVVKMHPDDLSAGAYQIGDLILFAASACYPMPMANQDLVILQFAGEDDTSIYGHWPKETFDAEALVGT